MARASVFRRCNVIGCVESRPFRRFAPGPSSFNVLTMHTTPEKRSGAVASRIALVWLGNALWCLFSPLSCWRRFLALSLPPLPTGRPFGLGLQWYVLCGEFGHVCSLVLLFNTRNRVLASRFRARFSSPFTSFANCRQHQRAPALSCCPTCSIHHSCSRLACKFRSAEALLARERRLRVNSTAKWNRRISMPKQQPRRRGALARPLRHGAQQATSSTHSARPDSAAARVYSLGKTSWRDINARIHPITVTPLPSSVRRARARRSRFARKPRSARFETPAWARQRLSSVVCAPKTPKALDMANARK